MLGWWQSATPAAKRALVAASLGWMLDSFDVMLYALVLTALMRDLGMDAPTAGLLGAVNTGTAFFFGQMAFAGAVVLILLRRP